MQLLSCALRLPERARFRQRIDDKSVPERQELLRLKWLCEQISNIVIGIDVFNATDTITNLLSNVKQTNTEMSRAL